MEYPMPHPDPQTCAELTELRHALETVGNKMDALSGALAKHLAEEERNGPMLSEIITTWQQGVGVLRFIKMMAAVATFCGAILVFLHEKVMWK